MKITKRHINFLVEQRIKLDEKDYGFKSYDRGDDFSDPTKYQGGKTGERFQTVHSPHGSGRLTHKFKPVADYTFDATTKADKKWDHERSGKTSIVQVDRPEGKRFYSGQEIGSPIGDYDFDSDYPSINARAKAEFTPADSISTDRMNQWIQKKDFDIDPSWDMFNKDK